MCYMPGEKARQGKTASAMQEIKFEDLGENDQELSWGNITQELCF